MIDCCGHNNIHIHIRIVIMSIQTSNHITKYRYQFFAIMTVSFGVEDCSYNCLSDNCWDCYKIADCLTTSWWSHKEMKKWCMSVGDMELELEKWWVFTVAWDLFDWSCDSILLYQHTWICLLLLFAWAG